MQLLELRTQLTNMVGDYALVGQNTTDPLNVVPDYTTDGPAQTGTLNRLLNDAIRTVVDKLPSLFDQDSYTCRLSAGDFRIQTPQVRKLDRAEVYSALQGRGELCKTTMRTLRQVYAEDWTTVTTGEPEWIAPGQLRLRNPNLLRAVFTDNPSEHPDIIPGGLINGGAAVTADGGGVTFEAGVTGGLLYRLNEGTAASNLQAPFTLSFRVQYVGPAVDSILRVHCKAAAADTYELLATINAPGDYSFPITTEGLGYIEMLPGTNGSDHPADVTVDRVELRQMGVDGKGASQHHSYFITMPPADGDYEVRLFAWFYPDPLLNLYDSNEVTEKFHRLVLLLAATQWATDKGHEALTNHWGMQANRELLERLRDVGAMQLAELEDAQGRIDWVD